MNVGIKRLLTRLTSRLLEQCSRLGSSRTRMSFKRMENIRVNELFVIVMDVGVFTSDSEPFDAMSNVLLVKLALRLMGTVLELATEATFATLFNVIIFCA